MRIGTPPNFLSVDLVMDDGVSFFRVEAVVITNDRQFTACHERVVMGAGGDTLRRYEDFSDFKCEDVDITLSEGGHIRLQRDWRGQMMVKYRLAAYSTKTAMEGEVLVEGDFAGEFIREFGALLRNG